MKTPPHWESIGPPPLGLFALEQGRALLDLASVRARRGLLAKAPPGDGHPVLVLPGLLAGDYSTAPLRRFLRALGYDAHGWGLGVNLGPRADVRVKLEERLRDLEHRHRRRVSLIGWSLGGIYARELARAHPERVRFVITLASPFRDISASHAARFVPIRPGGRPLREAHELRAWLRQPIVAPATAVFSRTDGIVAWQSCLEEEGPLRENVEVRCSHTGMGFHPAVLEVIADRLAQREGAWHPFARDAAAQEPTKPASRRAAAPAP
jgi:pimeloyl-ACP methyl ester carboxylesterase